MRLVDLTAIAIERTSLYQKMTELAITDDLTKLFNTRYLNRTIEIEIQRSTRYNTSVSLIFMDVDYFKRINDRLRSSHREQGAGRDGTASFKKSQNH